MKNKFLNALIKFAITVAIIILILISSNVIYKIAAKYNIIEEVADVEDTTSTIEENEIIEEKDKICYLSKHVAHSHSQYHLRHCILEKVMKCCLCK